MKKEVLMKENEILKQALIKISKLSLDDVPEDFSDRFCVSRYAYLHGRVTALAELALEDAFSLEI